MTWKRLPALDYAQGCPCCPRKPVVLGMGTPLAVGFGIVSVTRDGEYVWQGDDTRVWLRRFERRAAADPHHDWRGQFLAPMSDNTYQRQGEREWVLVEKGIGFA